MREIAIEGNQRIEAGTVLSYMQIKEGDAFDKRRINRSLKSLFATGLFADVTIRRQGEILIVNLIENPVINRIAFEGNKKLGDEDLSSELTHRKVRAPASGTMVPLSCMGLRVIFQSNRGQSFGLLRFRSYETTR